MQPKSFEFLSKWHWQPMRKNNLLLWNFTWARANNKNEIHFFGILIIHRRTFSHFSPHSASMRAKYGTHCEGEAYLMRKIRNTRGKSCFSPVPQTIFRSFFLVHLQCGFVEHRKCRIKYVITSCTRERKTTTQKKTLNIARAHTHDRHKVWRLENRF